MDPNLFHLDWERTFEALVAIVVLSFFVERACALVFESRWYIRLFEDRRVGEAGAAPSAGKRGGARKKTTKKKAATAPDDGEPDPRTPDDPAQPLPGRRYPIKEGGAFLLAGLVCLGWDFDAVSMILLRDHTHIVGKIVTAAVIAGGSKASVKLFHDLMGVRSNAEVERQALKAGDA